MAIIPFFFMNAVVALGIDRPDGTKHWIGTGFIVGRKETDNPDFSTHYIITNKHVIKGQKYIYVRFNSTGGELVKDYPVNLYEGETPLFTAHPHTDTDVIAVQILPQTLINDNQFGVLLIWIAMRLHWNK